MLLTTDRRPKAESKKQEKWRTLRSGTLPSVFCLLPSLFFIAAVRAEQPAPPHGPAKPEMKGQVTDWGPYLADLQGTDKAKQEAAAQVFLDGGQAGHNALGALLSTKDPELKKRVYELRSKIESNSYKMFQEAMQKRANVLSQPLNVESLEDLKSTWLQVFTQSTVVDIKKRASQMISDIGQTIANVEAANKQLSEVERQLKADPPPQGLFKAALEIARAQGLRALFRHQEALTAAQEAKLAAGKKSRLTPSILRIEAEIYHHLMDFEGMRGICRTIIADFPRSMETHFAHQQLLETYAMGKNYDEAIRELKEYYAAFPVDDDVQQSIAGMLQTMMDQDHDYKHVAELADWALTVLPAERIDAEMVTCFAGCNEYFIRDFAKADRGYSMLREYYPDAMDPKDTERALGRVREKATGKYLKEPAETEDGPAGAVAGFLRAVRTRDAEALKTFSFSSELDSLRQEIQAPGPSIVPMLTFCDVLINNIEYSPTKENATVFLTMYPSSGKVSYPAFQLAFKEDGKWKIKWRAPEEPPEGAENAVSPAQSGLAMPGAAKVPADAPQK